MTTNRICITTTSDSIKAIALVASLRGAGIKGARMSGIRNKQGLYEVRVPTADEAKAKKVLGGE